MKKALVALSVVALFATGLMYYLDRNFLYTPFSKLDEDEDDARLNSGHRESRMRQ